MGFSEFLAADPIVKYDLILLILFTLFVIIFLYTRKHNLQKEGLMYLYRTQWGVKYIDKFAKKYKNILKPTQYAIIFTGYILMAIIIYLIINAVYVYFFKVPAGSDISKVPVILPLLPYFSSIPGVSQIFPTFYFTHFIIAIVIVATFHEFAHGIFLRLHNLKIKSTGFAFLGPFLGAFVEQDDKQMKNAKTFPQLAILGAGVFANVLLAIIFLIVFVIFFSLAFAPAGVNLVNVYPYSYAPIENVSQFAGNSSELVELIFNNKTYFVEPALVQLSLTQGTKLVPVFDDTPSLRSRILGDPSFFNYPGINASITEIDGQKITGYQDLNETLSNKKPYENVTITMVHPHSVVLSKAKIIYTGYEKSYNLTLGEKDGRAVLGIVIFNTAPQKEGILTRITSILMFSPIKDYSVYYKSKLGEFGIFIYYLLWWLVLINILVAIFNMLPAGIFDGGRFFYLSVLALTRSKKIADKTSNVMVKFMVIIFYALIIKWIYNLAVGLF